MIRAPTTGLENFAQTDAELAVDDQQFSASDQAAVGDDVHRIAGQFIEFNDGTFAQLQDVFNQDLGSTEFDRDVEFPVVKILDR